MKPWNVVGTGALLIGLAVAPPARAQSRSAPDTARVHVGPAEGGTAAFVVWPPGEEQVSAVVVVHEWWGLNEQIREVARQFARQGYAAIVPDLYHGPLATEPEQAHVLLRGLEEERAIGEIRAAGEWMRAQPRVARRKIGVVGFCMGGTLSQKAAMGDPGFAAAVMFYGTPVTDPAQLARLGGPLQAHFGEEDLGIRLTAVNALRAGLAKAGKRTEIYTYPGAGHAFMHEGRPSYRRDAARQAWARTLAFLQKHLKS